MDIKKKKLKGYIALSVLIIACLVMMLSIRFSTLNIDRNQKSVYAATQTNTSVTYDSSASLGKFVGGYVYQFTDQDKFAGYRATPQTQETDVTTITVNSGADHGTQANPYAISSIADWEKFAKFCGTSGGGADKYYVLANDIDFSGARLYPIAVFNGTFYGNGHTLKNVTIGSTDWVYWNGSAFTPITTSATTDAGFALFCKTNGATTITDLMLDNFSYTALDVSGFPSANIGPNVASIVGVNRSGTLNLLNCQVKGNYAGTYKVASRFAGLVSMLYTSTTTNFYRCVVDYTLTAENTGTIGYQIGGLFNTGNASSTTNNVYDCIAKFTANVTSNTNCYGGTVGSYCSSRGVIENFIGKGEYISSTSSTTNNFPALVTGDSSSNITAKNCFVDLSVNLKSTDYKAYTTAGNNFNAAKLSTVYQARNDTLSFVPTISKSSSLSTASANMFSTNTELIEKAQSILTNTNVWKWSDENVENNTVGYGINDNPLANYDIRKDIANTQYSKTYDGQAVDFKNFFLDANGNSRVTVATTDNLTDAGEHTLRVTLNDNNLVFNNSSNKTETVRFTINKKKIAIDDSYRLDDYGNLLGEITSTTPFYQWDIDNDKTPQFGLQYLVNGVWSTSVPQNAGHYEVRAYIINADNCNYELSDDGRGQRSIEIEPRPVTVPHFTYAGIDPNCISGTVTTVPYNGERQTFILVNNVDNTALSDISSEYTTAGGFSISGSQFSAQNVGDYTVTLSLADPANTVWADASNNPSDTRTVTLKITKAPLTVEFENDTVTSWEKGDREYIYINVSGALTGETPDLNITYTEGGESSSNANWEVESRNGDTIRIKVNPETFSIGTQYTLNVALSNRSVNDNYTLDNDPTTSFTFVILASTISNIPIQWQYENSLLGVGNATAGIEVNYNGYPYTFSLKETDLPRGLNVAYSSTQTATNAGSYSTTVTFTAQEGYSLADEYNRPFTINWTIKPIEFDLATIRWQSNPTYNGSLQTVDPTNLPDWLTSVEPPSASSKRKVEPGDYEFTYKIVADNNHIFVISTMPSGDSARILEGSTDRTAEITHSWKIEKIVIEVSNFDGRWSSRSHTDGNGIVYYLKVPNVYSSFEDQLELKYYNSPNFVEENEVDLINGFTVNTSDAETYYIKVSLKEGYQNHYRIYNEGQDYDYAWISIRVGGNYIYIDITVNQSEFVYNGSARPVDVVAQGETPIITYYNGLSESDGVLSGAPKDVGQYLVTISFEDETCIPTIRTLTLNISALELSTDGWNSASGRTAPTVNVIANATDLAVDVNTLFVYKVFDASGAPVDINNLAYNTAYTISIEIAESEVTNVHFSDDAERVLSFRTEIDPENPPQKIAKPNFVKDVYMWTGDDITFEIAGWDNYSQWLYIEETGGISLLTQQNCDTYHITLKFIDSVNFQWLEDDTNDDLVLEYRIIPRTLDLPQIDDEIKYNGEEVNIYDHISPSGNWERWAVEVSGSSLETNAGKYSLTFKLNPDFADSIGWSTTLTTIPQSGVTYALNDDGEIEVTINWEIKPARITAVWNTEGEIPTLSGLSEEQSQLIEYVYTDSEGSVVEDVTSLEAGTYTVTARIKSEYAGNYVFEDVDGQVLANATSTEKSFEIKAEEPENPDDPIVPVDPTNPEDPEPPVTSFDFSKILDAIKNNWQPILSIVSILFSIIFMSKGFGYAGKRKKAKKTIEKRYTSYYAISGIGLFGLSNMNWTIIAGIMAGVAVLAFIFMLLQKRAYNKALEDMEDAKEEYNRNMFMRGNMNGGMGMSGQAGVVYTQQPQFAIEDMRGMINEAMSNMLPTVTQYIPQQASVNDELVQQLIEQNAQNEERIRHLTEENEEKIRELTAQNEEIIRNLAQGQEILMQRLAEQPKESVNEEVIEKLVEKLAKQQMIEQDAEKEVASAVVNEKTLEELKETIRAEIQTQMTAKAEKAEKDEKDEKIEMLLKANERLMQNQEMLLQRLANQEQDKTVYKKVENSDSTEIIKSLIEGQRSIMEKLVDKPNEKHVEKIVEKEAVKEVPVEKKIVEVEKVVPMPVEKPAKSTKAPAPRLTLDEAYAKLSDRQKKIFDTLKAYAMSKDKCKEKKSTYFTILGQSTVNPLVKLTIKKNTTVAMFKMEDEFMKDIRRNATSDGTKVKVKETELVVGDNQALSTAKEMIDLREDQIERYNDYLREQRSMKRK